MFCKSCGEGNDDDAQFCVKCGLKIQVAYSPEAWRDEDVLDRRPGTNEKPLRDHNPVRPAGASSQNSLPTIYTDPVSYDQPVHHNYPVQNSYQPPVYVVTPPQQILLRPAKSRGIYIILALFFGCLGIHNFYAGYNGRGIAQFLITVFGACVGVGILVTFVWALIEIFAVNTDAQGVRMN
ncbi:MAG TPA: TM2 domain-containing protein [Pyrinomonadaceae bacterium]|nr:TM2 domain-containing protein [Pyrinomonadaceae bacterium]